MKIGAYATVQGYGECLRKPHATGICAVYKYLYYSRVELLSFYHFIAISPTIDIPSFTPKKWSAWKLLPVLILWGFLLNSLCLCLCLCSPCTKSMPIHAYYTCQYMHTIFSVIFWLNIDHSHGTFMDNMNALVLGQIACKLTFWLQFLCSCSGFLIHWNISNISIYIIVLFPIFLYFWQCRSS